MFALRFSCFVGVSSLLLGCCYRWGVSFLFGGWVWGFTCVGWGLAWELVASEFVLGYYGCVEA